MNHQLPDIPQTTEVEIELTNICNAACTTCPREEISAPSGYMTENTFTAILVKYAEYRKSLPINAIQHERVYPFICFAGMGDPLLHPRAYDFIKQASDYGFHTILITNASALNQRNAHKLIDTGLGQLFISFWGIEPQEYAASMHLDFDRTLRNVEYIAQLARDRQLPLSINWMRVPTVTSQPARIKAFWDSRGIAVDMEDNNPWNRGGNIKDISWFKPTLRRRVDYAKEIWCSQLFFTDTVCWNGDVIVCCNDYYKKTQIIGNLVVDDPGTIAMRKYAILAEKRQLPICLRCTKPTRNYTWGSAPWDKVLDASERSRYWHEESSEPVSLPSQ